jgi:hypothetical protein
VDEVPARVAVGAGSRGLPGLDLADEVGVGDPRSRHPDQVGDAAGHQLVRRRDVRHLGQRHHRDAGRDLPHAGGQVRERRVLERQVRDVVLEARAEVRLADRQVVGRCLVAEHPDDPLRLVQVDAALDVLVRAQLEPDGEVRAAGLADPTDDRDDERRASCGVPTPRVLAVVAPRRQELGDQIAVRAVQLDAVEARVPQVHRRPDKAFHHLADLGVGHRAGGDAAVRVTAAGGSPRLQRRVPQRLPPDVPQLAEHRGTGPLARLGQPAEAGHEGLGIRQRHRPVGQ